MIKRIISEKKSEEKFVDIKEIDIKVKQHFFVLFIINR